MDNDVKKSDRYFFASAILAGSISALGTWRGYIFWTEATTGDLFGSIFYIPLIFGTAWVMGTVASILADRMTKPKSGLGALACATIPALIFGFLLPPIAWRIVLIIE